MRVAIPAASTTKARLGLNGILVSWYTGQATALIWIMQLPSGVPGATGASLHAQPHTHHPARGRARLRQLRGALRGWPGSKFFYWDDVPARRLRPEIPTSVVALVQAKAFARAMSDNDDAR